MVGALASGAALYAVFEKQKRQQRESLEADAKETADRLEKELKDSQKKAAIAKAQSKGQLGADTAIALSAPAAPKSNVVDDPEKIIGLLTNLDVEDDYTNRRAVHYFESLVDIGPTSLQPIREFLERDPPVDLVFEIPDERRGRFSRRPRGGREREMQDEIRESDAINYFQPFPKPNSGFPPTLRLGLLEATAKVGAKVGGSEAEDLLTNVLSTTSRGVEIAYLDLALEEIEPGKYREAILENARDILANPPPESNATKLDERSKGYLYAILVKYKDEKFVEIAKGLLVSDDGTLDGYALLYLRQVLGERALPIFLNAYRNPNITNKWEKAAISDAAMHYVGRNGQADEIWREMMKDGFKSMEGEDMFSEKRYEKLFLPVVSLARDMDDQDVDTIKKRRKLLGEARKGSGDLLLQFGLTMLDRRMGEAQKKKEEKQDE